jgi:hypothetical protein
MLMAIGGDSAIMVAVALLVGLARPVAASPRPDFYVSPTGNDAWSGTLAEANKDRSDGPFATPHRARDAVRALPNRIERKRPTVVMLRAGRYELAEPLIFTPADSGTAESPVRWLAYPGEVPVISGGRRLAPTVDGEDWVLALPNENRRIRMISVGRELRLSSRWPKEGFFTMTGLAGADPRSHYRTPARKFEFGPDQIDTQWPQLHQAEVVVLHFWVAGHYGLAQVDAVRRQVILDRPSMRRFTEAHGPEPGRYYLLNIAEKIAPGDFFHDRTKGELRYRPRPGETAVHTELIVPHLQHVIRFEGDPGAAEWVEHVELSGLEIRDSLFDLVTDHAGDVQAAHHVPGAVYLRGVRSCTIRDCRLRLLGGYGIELAEGCRDNRIIDNELADLAAGGIRQNGGDAGSDLNLRTGSNQITDNHLHHLGRVFHGGVGILSQHADQNIIAHNHIHDLYYSAISIGWVWGYGPSVSRDNRIENNHLHDIGGSTLSDMGAIYLLGVSPRSVVRGNHIHDMVPYHFGGWGVYTDEGSSDILIDNNLVYRTRSGGFHQHFGRDNVIRNNIFAMATEGQIIRSRAESHHSFTFERNIVYAVNAPLLAKNWHDRQYRINHNLYWDAARSNPPFPGGSFSQWQARGNDVDSLLADPGFLDPDEGDFRLPDDSPAYQIGFKAFDVRAAGVRRRDSD